jgi:acetolactate decarboxylase
LNENRRLQEIKHNHLRRWNQNLLKWKYMPKITADIPTSLNSVLNAEIARSKTDASSIVTAALAQYLKTPVHTLFQVSTSGALVAGGYSGAVSVESLLQHGDFGLGTFSDLDGEMVVLDRHVYQVQGTGRVSEAPPTASAPFAVVTRFSPETDLTIGSITNFTELQKRCDGLRTSGNIFYAFRLDGTFKRIRTRAVSPPEEGARLIDAAKAQSEFRFTDVSGTLVGLWSPGFSSAFSIAGYHFHFLSEDRQEGGHLLDLESGPLRLRMEALTDFHLALPETESFLKADLSKNTADELAYAESAH